MSNEIEGTGKFTKESGYIILLLSGKGKKKRSFIVESLTVKLLINVNIDDDIRSILRLRKTF